MKPCYMEEKSHESVVSWRIITTFVTNFNVNYDAIIYDEKDAILVFVIT